MKRLAKLGIPVLCLFASVPLASQDKDSSQGEGMTEAEIVAVLDAGIEEAGLRAQMKSLAKQMMEPGEEFAGWQTAGTDIRAYLDGFEGGLENNFLHEQDAEVITLSSYTNRPLALPPTVSRLTLRPHKVSEDTVFAYVGSQGSIWMEMSADSERIGTAECSATARGIGMVLLSANSPDQWTEEDWALIAGVYAMSEMTGLMEICVIVSEENGVIRDKTVNRSGQLLPMIDSLSAPQVVVGREQAEMMLAQAILQAD